MLEDFNGDFNVIDNYPDLDGDGYGEAHGFRYLGEDGLDINKTLEYLFWLTAKAVNLISVLFMHGRI